jgi:membrane-associated phospholipid phosphatase
VDQRLFLDVNRFAARTAWAHSVAAFLARPWALAILALLVLVAMLRARAAGLGGSDLDQIAALIWVVVGAGLALAVSLPIVHLVARERPFVAMPSVVVLVPRPTGFSFPNEHAVIAGAVAAGLWLSRSYLIAALATLYAVLVSFAVVYAGTAYPGDALAGLLLGAVVTLGLYPFAIVFSREMVHAVARSPLKFLVGGGHHGRTVGPGPAAHPAPVGESGAVRILSASEAKCGAVPAAPTAPTGGAPAAPAGGAPAMAPGAAEATAAADEAMAAEAAPAAPAAAEAEAGASPT